jgi:competence protein ComEA
VHRSIPPDLDDLTDRFGVRATPRPLLVAVALVLAVAVGWWLVRPAAAPVESTIPLAGGASAAGAAGQAAPDAAGGSTGPAGATGAEASATSTTTSADTTTTLPELVVQAAGAVDEPGVRRLPAGSRVDDLIRASGGFAPDADRDRINLAAALHDGERIWIPRRGDRELPDVVAGSGGGTPAAGTEPTSSGGGASTPTQTGPVDLNAATEAQLDALPGVGPATAAAILAHRDEVGRFSSVDELLDVRGIGEAKLEQLRPLVTV